MRKFFLFTKYLRTNSIKKQFFNIKNILQKLHRLKSTLKLTNYRIDSLAFSINQSFKEHFT